MNQFTQLGRRSLKAWNENFGQIVRQLFAILRWHYAGRARLLAPNRLAHRVRSGSEFARDTLVEILDVRNEHRIVGGQALESLANLSQGGRDAALSLLCCLHRRLANLLSRAGRLLAQLLSAGRCLLALLLGVLEELGGRIWLEELLQLAQLANELARLVGGAVEWAASLEGQRLWRRLAGLTREQRSQHSH